MKKIAIIGIGCLFPDAHNIQQFWNLLVHEHDSRTHLTQEQIGVAPEQFYAATQDVPNRYYSMRGGYISNFNFDPTGYALSAEALIGLDKLYQWALYVAREALLDSGYLNQPSYLEKTGVVLGNLSFPIQQSHQLLNEIYVDAVQDALHTLLDTDKFQLPRLSKSQHITPESALISAEPACLIAKGLALGGRYFALDAACASSLYAIKLACDYLQSGKADLMLAGAVSGADPLNISAGFSIFQALPTDTEDSAPLDRRSKGLIASEGAAMLVLKRLTDAQRDGDRVYATILATGLSNDGSGKHVLTPKAERQITAFERAYQAGIDLRQVDYIECHATGTPVGDAAELKSIETFFFKQGGSPLLGSVKSNLGHLLTAAGMASVIKVILSMQQQQIPPTIHVADPLTSESGLISSGHIVRELTAWNKLHKIAAVDAFGFGGTNAHLVLESPHGLTEPVYPRFERARMAIVGMDVLFADCDSLAAFERTIRTGKQHFRTLPPQRWYGLETQPEVLQHWGLDQVPQGGYVESYDLDFLKYKIPPVSNDVPIPQQLLMLKVADRAIEDARLHRSSNVAVLIAMDTELSLHRFRGRLDLEWQLQQTFTGITAEDMAALIEVAQSSLGEWPGVNHYASAIGNIIATRIASAWDFSGPAFTISAQENSVAQALEIAQMMLDRSEVEAVVIGAVDLSGGVENVALRQSISKLNTGRATFSYSQDSNGWLIGEGAGAIVLKREDQSMQDRIYGYIEAVSLDKSPEQACRIALEQAHLRSVDVGYIEAHGSGYGNQDDLEQQALSAVYGDSGAALGSIKANIGHTFAASGMASLIKTALCLYRRYIPPVAGWSKSKTTLPFDVPSAARPWFPEPDKTRVAACSTMNIDGQYAHIVLSEGASAPSETLAEQPAFLIPLVGDSVSEILSRLNDCKQYIEAGQSLDTLINNALDQYSAHPQVAYCLSLIAQNRDELLHEIALAERGVQSGAEWQTPTGSCFTPIPQRQKVAFVYPGAFSPYLGLGRDLFYAFPELFDQALSKVANPAHFIGEHYLYPRSAMAPTDSTMREGSERFSKDHVALIETGVSFSVLYTLLMRMYFGIEPAGVFGYSLGESSMLYATGAWEANEAVVSKLQTSALFKTRLIHANEAAADYLHTHPDEDFWQTYHVIAPLEQVNNVLQDEPLVFIALINTPESIIISGEAAAIQRVITRINGYAKRSNRAHCMHCAAGASEYDALVAMHVQPVNIQSEIDYYSAAFYDRVDMRQTPPNEWIARMLTTPVDFPKLVNKLYDDGYRIFLELGAGNTCTGWIGSILKDCQHVAIGVAQRDANEVNMLLKALGKLASHRVPVELNRLKRPVLSQPERSLVKTVYPGGLPIKDIIVCDDNRKRFADLKQFIREFIPPQAVTVPILTTSHNVDANSPLSMTAQHIAFLNHQRATMQQTMALLSQEIHAVEIYMTQPAPEKSSVIWDEADLLEFAQGSIANVFGEDYAVIDTYTRRVRMPMPPYLLVSRVVYLEGALGEYKPSRIITEYEIPHNAWYTVDRQASWAISVESGQCDLLLISYLGIDLENRGELVYRLLDCTMTFLDKLPMEGDTLRYDIRIESFARSGANLLFFFNYDCYIGERQVLKMRGGCAGFFSDQDLAQGGGIITTAQELAARQEIAKQQFLSPLFSPITSLSQQEMLALTRGEIAAVFGKHYEQQGRNPSLRLPPEALLMINEIPHIDPRGGRWGLGLIEGEKHLHPTHWYFPCHFKDDQVLAGSLMAEGCGQLLQAYMLYLGLQVHTQDARFQPLFNLPQVVRCRGQVTPQIGKLTYRMEIKEIGLKPHPYVKADVDIILNEKTVVRFEDLGLQLLEKATPTLIGDEIIVRKPALFNEKDIEAFCTGSIARCFGQEYLIYEGRPVSRIPNGDFKLMSRALEIQGKRHDLESATLTSEYDVPPDAWYYRENAYPTVPYSILMEIALQPCGFLSAYLGTTLTEPDVNFKFRNLDGDGRLLQLTDLRGQTITNRVRLTNTSAMQGMIVQTFAFELSCASGPFFAGSAVFGHFADHVLARQVGLDGGQETVAAYGTSSEYSGEPFTLATSPFYDIPIDKPHYHLSGDHFDLLDDVLVGDRYIYAEKTVDPEDWFFACHFYQDPVMPGSLGVEAMLEAIQAYALYHHLGREFRSPHFDQVVEHQVNWKYRGQVLPTNHRVSLEVFITDIIQKPDEILIFGDANLWKDNLRIYSVKQLALSIREGATL